MMAAGETVAPIGRRSLHQGDPQTRYSFPKLLSLSRMYAVTLVSTVDDAFDRSCA